MTRPARQLVKTLTLLSALAATLTVGLTLRTMIAYTVATEGTLYVSDLLTGDRAILFDGGNVTQVPRWQPEGNLITFGSGGTYWSVLPDGAELTPLVSYELNQYGANFFHWSPDGRHLVFRESSYRGFKYFYQLKRLDIQTGEMIELTSDLDKATNKRPLAWLPE